MKRIVLSLLTLGVIGALATGASTALLSDEEVSTGNTFTAGAVDLGVDNHSYYNGNECAEVDDDVWQWVGDAEYPVPGTSCENSWAVDYDITRDEQGETEIRRFFTFDDLKPGDWGEDTISLHVDNNDAFLCVDVTLTSDDDNGLTEPEADDGDNTDGVGEGELADAIIFAWWADDGDNVYEDDETLLPAGPLGALGVGETATVPLADSQQNIWNENLDPGSVPGDETLYIGKMWCFGDMVAAPVAQDGQTDGSVNNPSIDPGFTCNGAPLNNETQTDSATLDISFQAVQSRHNGDFFCLPQAREEGVLVINKDVVGSTTAQASDFTFFADGDEIVEGDAGNVLLVGSYLITETGGVGNETYDVTFGGDCDASGNVTVSAGATSTCTIVNDVVEPGTITVDKIIQFTDEVVDVTIGDFDLFIDDGNGPIQVTDQVAETGLAPGSWTVSETYTGDLVNISIDAQFSGACTDDGDTGTVTLGEGEDLTCTITNVITVLPV